MALQEGGITVTAELGLKKYRNQQNKWGRFTGVIEEYVIPPEQSMYLEDQKYLGKVRDRSASHCHKRYAGPLPPGIHRWKLMPAGSPACETFESDVTKLGSSD